MSYDLFTPPPSYDDLMHYGRKGMKWYQHIFTDPETSGHQRRLARNVDNRIRKNERLAKQVEKQNRKAVRAWTARGWQKHTWKAQKATWKSEKNKRIANAKVSELKNTEAGKQFIDELLKRYPKAL